MRVYENCKEAYDEILRDIVKFGRVVHSNNSQDLDVKDNADYDTKEAQFYSFVVIDDSDAVSQANHPE